jgi:hypothetical protein
MLRIPVCMHNVPEEDVFRPSAWPPSGRTAAGADFRACANFGRSTAMTPAGAADLGAASSEWTDPRLRATL